MDDHVVIPEKDFTEQYKELHARYGPGKVSFYACPICGCLEWGSTDRSGDNTVVLINLLEESRCNQSLTCQRCFSVERRNPEVYAWVLHVLGTRGIDVTKLPPLKAT